MHDIIEKLRSALPLVWAGTETGLLTGNAIVWGTIQNLRARREIPDGCFVRSGPKIIVLRDPFLDWWGARLSDARLPSPSVVTPRRAQRRWAAGKSSPP